MMLIMTHHENQNPENMVMVDDGTGLDVAIPTVMINRVDGEKIKKAILDTEAANKDATKKKEYVVLLVNFEMENPDDRVEYDVWYTSGDSSALNFLRQMKDYNEKLGANALFTPRMIVRTCRNCDMDDPNCLNIGNELYCAAFTREDIIPGSRALKLGVDELCIHEIYQNESNAAKWWSYMDDMQECAKSHYSESCISKAMSKVGIDMLKLNICRRKEKEIIRTQQIAWATSRISYSPAVVINNRVYRVLFY
jgi:hypothetical protein